MVHLDLRRKITEGETYMIDLCDGYMGYTAIYRFDGKLWKRILFHKNCSFTNMNNTLTTKELKDIVKTFKQDEFRWLGILEEQTKGQ